MAEERQNYSRLYKELIESEKRISRSLIKPNNIYRISTYKNVEGETEKFIGQDQAILFVTGIYEKKVYGLKLSLLKPRFFFQWSKNIVTSTEILNENDEQIHFSDLTEVRDRRGNYMYESHIKNNAILKKPKIPYRSYNLRGIQYVSEVYLKKSVLELNYG